MKKAASCCAEVAFSMVNHPQKRSTRPASFIFRIPWANERQRACLLTIVNKNKKKDSSVDRVEGSQVEGVKLATLGFNSHFSCLICFQSTPVNTWKTVNYCREYLIRRFGNEVQKIHRKNVSRSSVATKRLWRTRRGLRTRSKYKLL